MCCAPEMPHSHCIRARKAWTMPRTHTSHRTPLTSRPPASASLSRANTSSQRCHHAHICLVWSARTGAGQGGGGPGGGRKGRRPAQGAPRGQGGARGQEAGGGGVLVSCKMPMAAHVAECGASADRMGPSTLGSPADGWRFGASRSRLRSPAICDDARDSCLAGAPGRPLSFVLCAVKEKNEYDYTPVSPAALYNPRWRRQLWHSLCIDAKQRLTAVHGRLSGQLSILVYL